jgi:hypothetical protein
VDCAAALLSSSGPSLAPEQVAALCARTDGWGAGLRLAAFALRRTGDVDRFLTDFSGDERSVADYLTGEVLAGLDTEDPRLPPRRERLLPALDGPRRTPVRTSGRGRRPRRDPARPTSGRSTAS